MGFGRVAGPAAEGMRFAKITGPGWPATEGSEAAGASLERAARGETDSKRMSIDESGPSQIDTRKLT